MIIPTIIEKNVGYDIFSRLLKDRIIFVGGREGEVDTASANMIIAQLLYLDADDPTREINLYINSPGGLVTAGLAIYDTMQFIKAPITTICMGQAMSFGAVLLAAGGVVLALSVGQVRLTRLLPLSWGEQGAAVRAALPAAGLLGWGMAGAFLTGQVARREDRGRWHRSFWEP